MLQRIQSIFLGLIGAFMIALCFLPIWEKVSTETSEIATMSAFILEYSKDGAVVKSEGSYLVAIFAFISASIAFASLFSYNNRMLQVKLNVLNILMISAVIGSFFYFIYDAETWFLPTIQGEYKFGFFIPLFCLILNAMATRFIRKDENLVRSANRIR